MREISITDDSGPATPAAPPSRNGQGSGPAAGSSGQAGLRDAVAGNEQIYAMLVESITHRVITRVDEKLARRQTASLAGIGIVLTALTAAGGYIGNLVLENQVETKVGARFDTEIVKRLDAVEFVPRLVSLRNQLQAIDEARAVDVNAMRSLLEEFRDLYGRYAAAAPDASAEAKERAARNRGELEPLFDVFARNVHAIDSSDLTRRLVEVAPDLAANSEILTQASALTAGRELLGVAGGARSWQAGEVNRDLFERYRASVKRARDNGYPELFLAFEPIVRMMEGRDAREIVELLRDVDTLRDADRQNYRVVMGENLSGAFVVSPDAASARVTERSREFLAQYRDRSATLDELAAAGGY